MCFIPFIYTNGLILASSSLKVKTGLHCLALSQENLNLDILALTGAQEVLSSSTSLFAHSSNSNLFHD